MVLESRHLTDTFWKLGADEMDIVLRQAVEHHKVTSSQVIADQHMSPVWYPVEVTPLDMHSQDALQYCSSTHCIVKQVP